MARIGRPTSFLLWIVGITLLTGCPMPSGGTGQNNPLLQEALSVSGADPARAVVLLERALSGDPRLAEAHLELGNLHYQRTHNYAAAIYHFEKYLQLEPRSTWTNTILPQIEQSKRELARTHLESISDSAMQRRVQSLMTERTTLLTRINELTTEVAQLKAALNQAHETAAPRPGSQRSPADTAANRNVRRTDPPSPVTVATSSGRTHRVTRGESLIGIGRAHGFTLEAMKAANPGINHDRLQVGQVIHLPR